MKDINQITDRIIGAAIKVHTELGPGLLESAYRECLYFELREEGHFVEKEKELPLIYRNVKLDSGYRIDLMVERRIVVELKAVKKIEDVHMAQLLTYLKLTNCQIGLLLNFNVFRLKEGINRLINKYYQTEKIGETE